MFVSCLCNFSWPPTFIHENLSPNPKTFQNKNNYFKNAFLHQFLKDTSLIRPRTLEEILLFEEVYQNHEQLKKHNCQFTGKVFGVGMMKTGTTSLTDALLDLGYATPLPTGKYAQYSRWFPPPFNQRFLYFRHYYDLMFHLFYSNINISENGIDDNYDYVLRRDVLNSIEYSTMRSFNFGDGPWLYYYPLYTTWFPIKFKKSKYIITVRSSVWKLVNSQLRFIVSTRYIFSNFTDDYMNDEKNQERIQKSYLMFDHFYQTNKMIIDSNISDLNNMQQFDIFLTNFANTAFENYDQMHQVDDDNGDINAIPNAFDIGITGKMIIQFLDEQHRISSMERKIAWKLWNYMIEILFFQNWETVNKVIKWNDFGMTTKQLAFYIAMRYDLHNIRVKKWFDDLKYSFGTSLNDDVMIIDFSREKDNPWLKLTSFLGCDVIGLTKDNFPKANPSTSMITFDVVPKHEIFDWKKEFNGKIPIMSMDMQQLYKHVLDTHISFTLVDEITLNLI